MEFAVYRTNTFDKEFFKSRKKEQKEIEKFEKKLIENPYLGKPLGYKFFREKKLKDKRAYFLVYKDLKVVLMVAVSDKKAQRETIGKIKENLDNFYQSMKEALKDNI